MDDIAQTTLHRVVETINSEKQFIQNSDGTQTLRHDVSDNPNPAMVDAKAELLLDPGADAHAKDVNGNTPCKLAREGEGFFFRHSVRQPLVPHLALHLPASLLAELHVQPKDQGEVIRAGEETTTLWDIGQVNIRIVDAPQVWACPVYFCPVEGYLLGATTLEIFGIMEDPGGDGLVKRVIRARPI